MNPTTCVFDLDGTLSDCSSRRHFVTGKHRDYEAFHALLSQDPVNLWCRRLMRSLYYSGYEIAVVSARPKQYEVQTRAWLLKNEVPFTSLDLLRENEDSTPDQEIKVAWLRGYGAENILLWVDDRLKVVDAIRREGITVLHCAEGRY